MTTNAARRCKQTTMEEKSDISLQQNTSSTSPNLTVSSLGFFDSRAWMTRKILLNENRKSTLQPWCIIQCIKRCQTASRFTYTTKIQFLAVSIHHNKRFDLNTVILLNGIYVTKLGAPGVQSHSKDVSRLFWVLDLARTVIFQPTIKRRYY